MSTCLAYVGADPEEVRTLLAAEAERIAATERALAADHLRNPFPPGPHTPQPPYQYLRLVLADAALDAVDGRIPQAYTRTCTLLASMRRVSVDPDDLIAKMVALAYSRGAATQLLELRRHYPVARLPADCAEAVAPVRVEEAQMCKAVRGEFRLISAVGDGMEETFARMSPDQRLVNWLLFDRELSDAWTALNFADACAPEAEALAARGLPPPETPLEIEFEHPSCAWAYLSCIYASVAMPKYRDYFVRALDDTASIRLLLAGQAVADGTATARDAVAASALEGYPVSFDDRGESAKIKLKAPQSGGSRAYVVDYTGLAPGAGG